MSGPTQQLSSETATAPQDPLTGLPPRSMLAELLTETRLQGQLPKTVSLLVVNLDRFKLVNDLCGHAAGDQVLRVAAERLRRTTDEHMRLLHLGGDEFALLVPHMRGDGMAESLARRILDTVSLPIDVCGRVVDVGASVGFAVDESGTSAATDLLRAACIAMSRAKRDGGGAFCAFEPSMDVDLRDRAALEDDLRSGIQRGEIIAYYQPIFSLRSADLVGFESLARWNHPQRGMLDPGTFIPIAEDLDAINDLCFTLLRQACRDLRSWPAHLTLSINVSPIQICDPDLPLRLLQILYAGGIAPGRLIVEITESALVRDVELARATITSLRNAGVKVALDDFGTGYSSLHHLRELQFDRIKIDRSFIEALDGFAGSKIVKAIVDLGQSLGMPVTAEGIETLEQATMLSNLGCTYGQGFLFGRPLPPAATLRMVIELEDDPNLLRAVGQN
ncbi:putative bifunctional diguanylate cyclase/phosphodiesterase [Sphingomonas cavernae]|uniref:putative bifunctional diguanylate cyclase/phosphodiesterase n=1 Tax=Sphingomonas cavernae TaxID=2320861 RepID=UPI0016004374|nr:bifunctional diguanylate cyclase/phosphodiesterase [Sphingomonas cavernae]